jgi:GT2 family glycosyltransferase
MPFDHPIKRAVANWLIRVPERVPVPERLLSLDVAAGPGGSRSGPEVPVYVVHWNAPEWCVRTVHSIRASDHVRPRVTIIDNGGLHAEAIGQLGEAEVVATGANLGFTGGVNRALEAWRATDAPVVVIACHDVELHPDALSLLLRAVEVPGVGIAGVADISTAPPASPHPPCTLAVDNVSWVGGALMVLTRDCVDAVGRFDERLGSYAEDVDYCWRATDAGWAIVTVRGVSARCLGQVAENSTLLTHVNSMRMVRYRRGRIGFGLRWLTELVLTAATSVRALVPSLRRRALRHLPVHRAALAELPLLWRPIDHDVLSWTQ